MSSAALALGLAWPGVSAAAPAKPAAVSPPPVVLPFPGLAPASATAKPKPPRRRRHPAAHPVTQAGPPPPPPPPAEHRRGDNTQLNLAELPQSARQALLDLHDRLAGAAGPCRGMTLSAFELGLTPIIATQYNDDGRPDFFFHDPCSPHGARAEGSTLLLLSDPLGYHLSPTFAAALGEVDGRPVLLAHAPCEADAPPTAPAACLLARFWDPGRRRWGDIQMISPDVAAGGGPVPTPLSAPAAPPPPQPKMIPASAAGGQPAAE